MDMYVYCLSIFADLCLVGFGFCLGYMWVKGVFNKPNTNNLKGKKE